MCDLCLVMNHEIPGCHWAGGKRVWVLGMPEGELRSYVNGVFLNCSKVTCPNPSFI
jgi:hypothetical protein